MSKDNQSLTEGNYLRIVIGLSGQFTKEHFLDVDFCDNSEVSQKQQELKQERIIYVLCKTDEHARILKSKIDDKSVFTFGNQILEIGVKNDGVVRIIDPDTLAGLGNYVKCKTSSADGYEIRVEASFINSPEWIPIENDKSIRVHMKLGFWGKMFRMVRRIFYKTDQFGIRVIDRRLGEIVYRSDSVEVTGTDLRVYGNEVRFEKGDSILIKAWEKKKGSKSAPIYQLEIKGNGISIKDVRTSDVDRIIIRANQRIKAVVEPVQRVEKKKEESSGSGYLWWLGFLLVIEMAVLVVLTGLPFWQFVPIRDKYLEVLQGGYATNEVVVTNSAYTPSVVTNTLSMQTSCSNVMSHSTPTNTIDTIATSVSSASGSPSLEGGKRQGVLGVTLYFVLSCLLYVVFYAMFVCFTFLTLRALRRKRKLTADMSGVLEALRNERDKDKRRAMQKKILDDMIDTYLDKSSSED